MNIQILKIFFDANVLIAGSFSQTGASFLLLQLCELGLLEGLTCTQAIDECRKNIRIKLPQTESVFDQIVARSIEVLSNSSQTEMIKFQNMANRKDLPILTVALTTKANYFVTFNIKHFNPDPKLGLVVCKPGRLLNEIRQKLMELTEK